MAFNSTPREDRPRTNTVMAIAPTARRMLVNMNAAVEQQQYVPLPQHAVCPPQVVYTLGVQAVECHQWTMHRAVLPLTDGTLPALPPHIRTVGDGKPSNLEKYWEDTVQRNAATHDVPLSVPDVVATITPTMKEELCIESTPGLWVCQGGIKVLPRDDENGSHAHIHLPPGVLLFDARGRHEAGGTDQAVTAALKRSSQRSLVYNVTVLFVSGAPGSTPPPPDAHSPPVVVAPDDILQSDGSRVPAFRNVPYGEYDERTAGGAAAHGRVGFKGAKMWRSNGFEAHWLRRGTLCTITNAAQQGGDTPARVVSSDDDSRFRADERDSTGEKVYIVVPTAAEVLMSAMQEGGTAAPTRVPTPPPSLSDFSAWRTVPYAAPPDGFVNAASPCVDIPYILPERALDVFEGALMKEAREELTYDSQRASRGALDWEGHSIPELLMRAFAERNVQRGALQLQHSDAVLLTFQVQDSSPVTAWFGTYVPSDGSEQPAVPRCLCVAVEIQFLDASHT